MSCFRLVSGNVPIFLGQAKKDIWNTFFSYRKSIKIISNTLKIEEKFSDVSKQFVVDSKKNWGGRVSGNETFFFAFLTKLKNHSICFGI